MKFILGLSELPLPNAVVGETFGNIIGEQFRRMKFGDRFWHETDDPVTGFTDGKRLLSHAGIKIYVLVMVTIDT